MNVAEFEQTRWRWEQSRLPQLSPPVLALWWDAKQAWDQGAQPESGRRRSRGCVGPRLFAPQGRRSRQLLPIGTAERTNPSPSRRSA